VAEEACFVFLGVYTADYGELRNKCGLVADPFVNYSAITLYAKPKTGQPGYKFTVRHKRHTGIAHEVDSAADSTVTRLRD
jgi:hypothetical protein